MWRMVVLLGWPLAEIALFVVIGGEIGLLATLGWIFLTAVTGMFLLRLEMRRGAILMQQGAQRVSLREGHPVAVLFRALAGVLLILPGFLTDAIGLLLLLPPIQLLLAGMIRERVTVVGTSLRSSAFTSGTADDIIDGEWVEVPPQADRRARPSRWVEGE